MRKFESKALQVMYEGAEDMFKCGSITAEQFHEFDDCLMPEPATPPADAVSQNPATAGAVQ
ncbi:hypothetical protein FACS1894172_12960 [Spirochaetia bacterium]|nr:hypothetical protein FACS1894164_08070 [Spirochaetia bacterium]GHU33763.1 hypothetical protein FACS1894172_12960 [Spirochaetia bacterium]